MCDSRDGKIVLPIRQCARMGWWIGRVISTGKKFIYINLLWVENPECAALNICSTPEYVTEVQDICEAMKRLRSNGVNLFPIEIGF